MPQYIVVMSYVPLGTLTQFLKENSIDWFTLCRMYLSTASGLAHLHSDIVKGGVHHLILMNFQKRSEHRLGRDNNNTAEVTH